MLIIPSKIKAIGEIIPIILVKDTCNIVVKTKPTTSIKEITPATTIKPNMPNDTLILPPLVLLAKYDKNPGYKGNMHKAVIGVNNPNTKELSKADIISIPA
jgi:hypothetical protein